MLRLGVIVLVAFNLVLAGLWLAHRPPQPARPADEPPPGGLPTITLMNESEPAPVPTVEQPRCFSLGPFETPAAMHLAQGRLAPLATVIRERTTDALMELGYWVELASFDEFGGPAEAVRALRQKGLEDVAVMSRPDGGRKVSLGYFLEERNARTRRDQARAMGFAAEIRVQRETQPRFWLDYVQEGDAVPAAEAMADAVPANLHRPLPCDSALDGVMGEAGSPAGF